MNNLSADAAPLVELIDVARHFDAVRPSGAVGDRTGAVAATTPAVDVAARVRSLWG